MPCRVLVFDENESALAILAEGLRLQLPDVVVDTARYIAEALFRATAIRFDVIICNGLPSGMGGAQVTSIFTELCPEAVLITIAPLHKRPADAPVNGSEIDELSRLVRVALGPVTKADPRRRFRRAS
jgi:hypothetical protein